jgi:1-acyl-sn-glycerol-3-phosphate acyltransferase
VFTALGALPVERGTHRAAQAALDTALGVLKTGGAFGIYPEGTRSKDGRLARGKTGVAWLALTADCPVVPVAVKGTDRVQPVGASWPRPHRVSITFGAPLTFPEQHGQAGRGPARRVVTDRVMEAIAELSGQEKAGWGAPRDAA